MEAKPKTAKAKTSEPWKPDELFVFGLDREGKPRGARFAEAKNDIFNAAFDMGLACVYPAQASFAEVAMTLPAGRIYASGKAFIPNIKRSIYDAVFQASELPENAPSVLKLRPDPKCDRPIVEQAAIPCTSPLIAGLPRDWSTVGVGQMVLIQASPEEGWWEGVVIARDDEVLTLRYRDYPKQPSFVRHISAVALVNPGPA